MRIRGTVKWFNDTKGYGFLRRDDGQSDCFVHHSDIQGEGYHSLQEGEKVEFDVVQQPKGPKAASVVKVDDAAGDAPAAAAPAPETSPEPEYAAPAAPAAPAATTDDTFAPASGRDDSEE